MVQVILMLQYVVYMMYIYIPYIASCVFCSKLLRRFFIFVGVSVFHSHFTLYIKYIGTVSKMCDFFFTLYYVNVCVFF
jgi:hypothetical protein